ncbi:DUF1850 domain-containing protein [Ideonella sp. BN130291]|uniref:DUF1850 domain-containing protein n=1 Tax=Ideonella sp. BN130291 TaxID=3112940 RepID=UPI002E258A7D|nr:DUF1850 domain-containing protein [Ideonella sp. BN130291]
MDLCVWLAAGTVLWLRSAGPVRIEWEHSVEHFRIEELYQATPAGVVLAQVGVRGLGAGVEPPADAVLADGWWRHAPAASAMPAVEFANSRHAKGYRACASGTCRPVPAGSAIGLRRCGP